MNVPEFMAQLRAEHESVFDPSHCPDHLREAFERYVTHGIPAGDCLRAVLANDMMGAFQRADVNTARHMAAIVSYVYNVIPQRAYGSYEAVDAWIAAHAEARRQRADEGE